VELTVNGVTCLMSDAFTRKWISYYFDVTASKDAAIQGIVNAMVTEKPDCSKLVIRTDNGSQYVSKKFRKSIQILGARQEFIWHHTPQQNGHVESFHKTLKKEYIWPHEFANYQSAEITIAKAFDDYNYSRIHSALGYITPNEFVKSWEMKHK
jgi:putative transposase